MKPIVPVILCGGSGTRLWPASRSKYPKQFMKLSTGSTLFSETLSRTDVLTAMAPVIVSNEEYRFYVKTELADNNREGTIILEPEARNTAPAIALAAFCALEQGDNIMLVLPSDHRILQPDVFCSAVEKAIPAAEKGQLVTFGIEPLSPETGYGYICRGQALSDGVFAVERFQEKPDKATAEKLLADGRYYWNAGIFLFRPSAYLEELKRFSPAMYEACSLAWNKRTEDIGFIRPSQDFCDSPSDSIDYGVMERTQKAAVCPVDCGWSDMGSWRSFYDSTSKDTDGNVLVGDVIAKGTKNCYVRSSGRLVSTLNVSDLAVIETKDSVLVADINKTQDVKFIVDGLKRDKRAEFDFHPRVFRPWGSYETLIMSDRFQVKQIIVNPGEQNSLQMHYHRAEHWVIVKGTAEVEVNGKVQILTENESVFVPLGSKHRIRNPGKVPLVFIEVQTGVYVGEDDIVRFEDNYGRADADAEEHK